MPTSFVKGDLFNTEGIRAYAHGCNCAGTMDAGVAVAFKKRWPRMFEEYAARCADGRFHLGDVFVWNEGSVVVYKALRKSVELAAHAGVERIGLPRIGAGLGGLEWPRVKSVLGVVGGETPVTLVVFEQFVRAPVESVVP
jgi:O-acetyl-ADP-ribose deacetylase (regulator of RNase III)